VDGAADKRMYNNLQMFDKAAFGVMLIDLRGRVVYTPTNG
jgi:hypothetical protein